MQESSTIKIDTFTIGFEDKKFDESIYAKKIANIIGTKHNELIINHKDIIETVSLIPKIYDEPFADSSQLATYLLSKFAKENVAVTLSGDGGNELFAGYNRYHLVSKIISVPHNIRKTSAKILNLLSNNSLVGIENLLIRSGLIKNNYQLSDKISKFSYLLNKKNFEELYQNLLFNYIDNTDDNIVLNSTDKIDLTASHELPETIKEIKEKMMYYDTLIYLPDDILCKVDRASMAVGLETRVPFLDKDVIEFAWKLPLSQKINNGKSKYILREILYDYLPKDLIERPKTGIGVP